MTTDYYSYKKIYTTGELFTRSSGEDFVGYAQYKDADGIVTDFETGEVLTPKNTYESDVFTSRMFKDRTIDDFNISLPISESECLFDLNDTLNFKEFKFKLEKIKENNAFVFSQLFIASNQLPRANSVSYSALTDTGDDSLTGFSLSAGGAIFGNPIFSSADNPDIAALGGVFDVTSQTNYDSADKFALFCVSETTLITLTGDDGGASIVEASTEYETISSNVLEFGRIGGVASNSKALFVSDTESNTIIKYDITGYMNNDTALANVRYVTSVMGGSGLVDRRANFSSPTRVACSERHVAVFDSDNICIKVFNTNLDYFTTLTFINLNKALLGKETFQTMAFDPDFNDLYILTTDDTGKIILYRANIQTRQIETVNIANELDSDEVIQSISFSRVDSNYWYFNTNKRIYKKYKTRPNVTGVGFYDEARLGDFRNGVIGSTTGENRWNYQNSNFNLTNFFWNFRPESEQIVATVAEAGVPIEAQKFRAFNIVEGPAGSDKVIIFTKSKIYHFDEPSSNAYQYVLNRDNYTNYGINGFTMQPDEYIQVAVINSEIYKLVYDLLLIKNNLVGRFAGKYVNEQLVLTNYNYNIEFSRLKRENVEDYFIHHNEENIVGALNRVFGKIYELQEFIVNATQVDVGTEVRDVVSVDGPAPEPEPEPEANLTIQKEIETAGPYVVGSDVIYKVTLSNTGDAPATNIRLSDSLNNITIISDPRNVLTSSITVNAGETITVRYSYTLDQPGQITNTVTTTGSIAVSDSITINVSDLSDLTINKTIVNEPAEITVGDVLSYKVTVTNTGGATATSLKLVDSLGIGNISNITGTGSDMITSVLAELSAGETVEVNYEYTVVEADAGSNITNTATLTFNPGDITITETIIDSVTTSTAVIVPGVSVNYIQGSSQIGPAIYTDYDPYSSRTTTFRVQIGSSNKDRIIVVVGGASHNDSDETGAKSCTITADQTYTLNRITPTTDLTFSTTFIFAGVIPANASGGAAGGPTGGDLKLTVAWRGVDSAMDDDWGATYPTTIDIYEITDFESSNYLSRFNKNPGGGNFDLQSGEAITGNINIPAGGVCIGVCNSTAGSGDFDLLSPFIVDTTYTQASVLGEVGTITSNIDINQTITAKNVSGNDMSRTSFSAAVFR